MIWRLTYCNKNEAEARVDIIKGDRTSVEVVQGSANPFTLSYKLDKNDKSGHIMTSSADIEFFETETFNIDDLKTSNETELKVEYFEGNILTWSGFILPDFFSKEIGSPNIIRMTASDRLSALKGVTLSDLPTKVSLRDLIELSLGQTGLSLALVAQIQINQGSTNVLDSEILSQRLTDTRGRSISCYDVLMSIMVATNSTIRQREGQWVVYNKLEHELRTPSIFFDKVEKGAIRTIQPVASSVGVYKEFGGSKTYPENYNFKSGGTGWTVNFPEEISASFSSNNVLGFDVLTSGGGYQPVYGDETNNPHVVIYGFRGPLNYLKSEDIPVPSGYTNEVDIRLDINASAPIWNFGSHQRVSVFAVKGERTQVLTSNGFVDISKSSESEYMHTLQFEAGVVLAGELARVDTNSLALSGKLSDSEGLDGYSVHIRLYSSDRAYATIINFASINFAPTGDSPKGDLYKTIQGSNFTKQHDVETTIFGDYITSGLNGYFYKYPIDDTSNLYLPSGELSSPTWITPFDTNERPLLHHISRQKSRLFSVAHDILKANINVESFDPLAVFQDCKGGKYVIVSASFDFLRSEVDVELEQIAYDNTILKRDFIYSYFGEGEDTIKSIGGIAGGTGGGGGGGMTPEQLEMLTNLASWWKLDEENDAIYSEKSVYSLKGISALGLGDGGSSGGGVDMLDSWANYMPDKADYYVPASLLVPFRNDTLDRLASLEGGSATSIDTTGSGNAITSVSKSGNTLTFAKGSTFSLSTHNHDAIYKPIGYVPSWSEITGKPSTFVPSAHTHTIAQITGLQGALDSKATQSDIDTAIDGIEIGGRNLMPENTIFYTTRWARAGVYEYKVKPGGDTFPLFYIQDYAEVGKQYTLSFELKSTVDGAVFKNNTLYVNNALTVTHNRPELIKDKYVKVYGSFTYVEGGSYVHIYINGVTNADELYIRNWKLEKGNKASDWTPAPEDQVTINTAQTITGAKTFNANITLGVNKYIQGTDNYTGVWNVDNLLWRFGSSRAGSVSNIRSEKVGIGTDSPLYKLDVAGTGRFTGDLNVGTNTSAKINMGRSTYNYITTPTGGGLSIITNGDSASALNSNLIVSPNGNVGVGKGFTNNTTSITAQLHVRGNILSTSVITASTGVNTPKVIFAAAGWSLEQVGTELQMKHNGVVKQRMLADGTILATGGITALST